MMVGTHSGSREHNVFSMPLPLTPGMWLCEVSSRTALLFQVRKQGLLARGRGGDFLVAETHSEASASRGG